MVPSQTSHARGFTLLEILVALSILALGLSAAIRSVTATTDTLAALHSRQLATWVAENQLALMRATRQWPELGRHIGKADMGDRQFTWQLQVDEAGQGQFRRIELTVVANTDAQEPLAHLVAFLAQP